MGVPQVSRGEEFNPFECKICFTTYQEPVINSCFHTFCAQCVKQWKEQNRNNYTCPICRAPMDANLRQNADAEAMVAHYLKAKAARKEAKPQVSAAAVVALPMRPEVPLPSQVLKPAPVLAPAAAEQPPVKKTPLLDDATLQLFKDVDVNRESCLKAVCEDAALPATVKDCVVRYLFGEKEYLRGNGQMNCYNLYYQVHSRLNLESRARLTEELRKKYMSFGWEAEEKCEAVFRQFSLTSGLITSTNIAYFVECLALAFTEPRESKVPNVAMIKPVESSRSFEAFKTIKTDCKPDIGTFADKPMPDKIKSILIDYVRGEGRFLNFNRQRLLVTLFMEVYNNLDLAERKALTVQLGQLYNSFGWEEANALYQDVLQQFTVTGMIKNSDISHFVNCIANCYSKN